MFGHVIPPFLGYRVLREGASADALFSVRRERMKRSCPYCGRIHERNFVCPKKPVPQKRMKHSTDQNKFRSKNAWTKKSVAIRKRDGYLCQICARGLYDPEKLYQTENLEVHHIVPLKNDYNLRLDDENLITLCGKHHEMAEAGLIPAGLLKRIAAEQCQK